MPAASKPSFTKGGIRFSEELAKLEEKSRDEKMTIGDIMASLDQRAHTFLLLLLSLPFIQPIPFPGLSTPFGLAIALIGTSFLLGQKPWLPRRLLSIELPKTLVTLELQLMRRLADFLELIVRPRITALTTNRGLQRLQGVCILGSGLLLSLPLPIPFTNMLPAVTVIVFSCASLGKDGLFYLAGLLSFVISVAFFGLIGLGGSAAIAWIYEWLAESIFTE